MIKYRDTTNNSTNCFGSEESIHKVMDRIHAIDDSSRYNSMIHLEINPNENGFLVYLKVLDTSTTAYESILHLEEVCSDLISSKLLEWALSGFQINGEDGSL